MLDEGAGSRSALEIADAVDFLGADLGASSGIDCSAVRLHVPVARLADALPIMADVALRPTFPNDELERLRAAAAHQPPSGARRSGDDRAAGLRARPLRHRRTATAPRRPAPRETIQGVHRRRSARVLRVGVPARQRRAARRRRRHAPTRCCRCSRRASAAGSVRRARRRSTPRCRRRRSPRRGRSTSSTSPARRSRRSASAGSACRARRRTTSRSR